MTRTVGITELLNWQREPPPPMRVGQNLHVGPIAWSENYMWHRPGGDFVKTFPADQGGHL